MKAKILIAVIVIMGVALGAAGLHIINLRNKFDNTTQFEIAKERVRQEKLMLQNEIYEVRAEKEVLEKILKVYQESMEKLKKNDEALHRELERRSNEIDEFSIDELENYFKDEFKDFE